MRSYLEALRVGNVDDALQASGYTAKRTDVLLDFNAYDDAKNTLTHYAISPPQRKGSTATVVAHLTFGSKRTTQTFQLRTSGNDFLFFPRWRLVPFSPGEVTVQLNGPRDASIYADGSRDITARGLVHLRALPGTYMIGLSGTDPVYAADLLTGQYYPGMKAAKTPKLTVWLTDQANATALSAVNSWLASCLASGSSKPTGCVYGQQDLHPSGGTLTNQTWTLDKAPTFEVGPWDGTGFPVVTTSPGAVAFRSTITLPDGRSGTYGSISDGAVVLAGYITQIDAKGATYQELDLTGSGSTPQT
ncbi:hypothetical protein ACX9R5_06370 [Rathayibacter sp. CAU 1779]